MGLNVKLDLQDCYEIRSVSDLKMHRFDAISREGKVIPFGVVIDGTSHRMIPEVYNLAYGPIDGDNNIDDTARVCHQSLSKVFSTVALIALIFMEENKNKFLGVDGSDFARARMYYGCIKSNYDYLSKYFQILGVKFYVRQLRELGSRGGEEQDNVLVDTTDMLVIPKEIEKNEAVRPENLYNYFIFKLRKQ